MAIKTNLEKKIQKTESLLDKEMIRENSKTLNAQDPNLKYYILGVGAAIATTICLVGGLIYSQLANKVATPPTPTAQPFVAATSVPAQYLDFDKQACFVQAQSENKSTWDTCWRFVQEADGGYVQSSKESATAVQWIGPTDLNLTSIGQYNQAYISEWYSWADAKKPLVFCIDADSMAETMQGIVPISAGCYNWTDGPFMVRTLDTLNVDYTKFQIVSLKDKSELINPESNLDMPPGNRVLAGVPFENGWKISTQCTPYEKPNVKEGWTYPTVQTLDTDITSPSKAYIIIQGGYGLLEYNGYEIGNLTFNFSDLTSYAYPLILGQNIRNWANDSRAVTTFSAPEIVQIWGGSADGRNGWADLLRIDLPQEYQNKTLVGIVINDTTTATTGSENPCMHILGITVEKK